jgi:hypothetical protein
MACNCSKGGTAKNYVYTSPDGKKTSYRSEVEAQAAKIRNKGGTYSAVSA